MPVIYSSNCLFVVCAGIYFDSMHGGRYCLSTASVLRWYSHTLNRIQTLIVLVETFFLASFFWFAVLLLFVV